MAAPASKTMKDLTGTWTMNKTLSDNPDKVLTLQDISYLTRAAIKMAKVSYDLTQYITVPETSEENASEITCLECIQTASGLKGSKDTRFLDDESREKTDWLFGCVVSHTRWADIEDMDDEFLKEGWLREPDGRTVIVTFSKNEDQGWSATQVNGFRMINGERRYCARSVVLKKDKRAEVNLVYDYVS